MGTIAKASRRGRGGDNPVIRTPRGGVQAGASSPSSPASPTSSALSVLLRWLSSINVGASSRSFPAGLEEDFLRLPDQAKDDGETGAGSLDRVDGRFGRGQRQERHDLAQVPLQLLAEILGGEADVADHERCTERLGALTNLWFFHRPTLRYARRSTPAKRWRTKRGGVLQVIPGARRSPRRGCRRSNDRGPR
jgi:hypothetical protein